MSLRFVQSEPLLEKLMIDAKKSLNFGYKLVTNVNINRLFFLLLLLFFGTETSDVKSLESYPVIINIKVERRKQESLFFMTLNTEFTSPPSCQCERALVHYCQLHCWTWPSLAYEELSKQLKVSRKNCVVSSVVSGGALRFISLAPEVLRRREVQCNLFI